jgi:NitT/TauT family transport system substrate-binding protein
MMVAPNRIEGNGNLAEGAPGAPARAGLFLFCSKATCDVARGGPRVAPRSGGVFFAGADDAGPPRTIEKSRSRKGQARRRKSDAPSRSAEAPGKAPPATRGFRLRATAPALPGFALASAVTAGFYLVLVSVALFAALIGAVERKSVNNDGTATHGGGNNRMVTRFGISRTVVAAAMALSFVAIPAGMRAKADTLRVGKAFPSAFGFIPIDVGVQQGIFKKQGLDIEITSFGGAPALIQGITAGSIDIGLESGTDLGLIPKGFPAKGVGATMSPPLEITVTIAPDSTMKDVDDLKGKKVAVSQKGALTGWLVSELSRRKGWGPNGIEPVPSGNTGLTAVTSHSLDGFTIDISTAEQLQRKGRARLLLKFGDYIKEFEAYVVTASDSLITTRPDSLRRFLKAYYETIAFMRDNKEKVVEIAADVQKVDPDIAATTYDVMMKAFSTNGRFEPEAVRVLARSFVELELLPKEPDTGTLITEEFLPR